MSERGKADSFNDITQCVSSTPLVQLGWMAKGCHATILCKMENMSPLWSVKDRIARAMIDAAEQDGKLRDDTVVMRADQRQYGDQAGVRVRMAGYRLAVTMPESMSLERRRQGPGGGTHPDSRWRGCTRCGSCRAEELVAANGNYFMPQQFELRLEPRNPSPGRRVKRCGANTEGKVDIFVAGVGTGRTITGVGELLKSQPCRGRRRANQQPGDHAMPLGRGS